MLSNLEIIPAAASHIPLIAPRMRPADRDEVWASAHMTPEEAIRRSLQSSPPTPGLPSLTANLSLYVGGRTHQPADRRRGTVAARIRSP